MNLRYAQGQAQSYLALKNNLTLECTPGLMLLLVQNSGTKALRSGALARLELVPAGRSSRAVEPAKIVKHGITLLCRLDYQGLTRSPDGSWRLRWRRPSGLVLTPYGRSVLYRNQGNGRFSEVSEKAGVGAPGWFSSVGASLDGFVSLLITPLSEFKNVLQIWPAVGRSPVKQ